MHYLIQLPNQPHGVDFLTAKLYKKLDKSVKNVYVRLTFQKWLRKFRRLKRREERGKRVTHPTVYYDI